MVFETFQLYFLSRWQSATGRLFEDSFFLGWTGLEMTKRHSLGLEDLEMNERAAEDR